jgi:hypothetical protein
MKERKAGDGKKEEAATTEKTKKQTKTKKKEKQKYSKAGTICPRGYSAQNKQINVLQK